MSVFTDVEGKFVELKSKLDGELHALVVKLESVFQHVQSSPVEAVVKEAVATDLHAAATKVEAVADTMRSDVDVVDKAVDAADTAVDTAVK